MENILSNLWDIAIALIENVSAIWDWLNKPFKLEIDLVLFQINLGSYVPIHLIGGGILVLIGFWFIKSLLPAA